MHGVTSSASSTSLLALTWLAFFMADVRDGLGPFLATYLQESGLRQELIGATMTAGGLAAGQHVAVLVDQGDRDAAVRRPGVGRRQRRRAHVVQLRGHALGVVVVQPHGGERGAGGAHERPHLDARVHVLAPTVTERAGGARRRRLRAAAVPPPLRTQPPHPAHAVPQHGPHVARHDARRRGRPHHDVRRVPAGAVQPPIARAGLRWKRAQRHTKTLAVCR